MILIVHGGVYNNIVIPYVQGDTLFVLFVEVPCLPQSQIDELIDCAVWWPAA